jgi:hypothetical protein
MSALKDPRREAFCQLYVFGDPRHDPKDENSIPDCRHKHQLAYERAGYAARGSSSRVNGYKALQKPEVQERISELRDDAVGLCRARRARWSQLFPEAQEYLWDVVVGKEAADPGRISAAKEIIARDEGPLSFRFRDPKTGKERSGIPVFVLGVDDDGEEEGG